MKSCKDTHAAVVALYDMGCPVSLRSILMCTSVQRMKLTRPLKDSEKITIDQHHDGSISVNFTTRNKTWKQ